MWTGLPTDIKVWHKAYRLFLLIWYPFLPKTFPQMRGIPITVLISILLKLYRSLQEFTSLCYEGVNAANVEYQWTGYVLLAMMFEIRNHSNSISHFENLTYSKCPNPKYLTVGDGTAQRSCKPVWRFAQTNRELQLQRLSKICWFGGGVLE